MSGGGLGVSGGGVEAQLASLLERLEERDVPPPEPTKNVSMMTEVRTLDLWRAVIAECLASVLYVFLVCGAYTPWVGPVVPQEPQARIVVSLVAGLAMAVLVHSFGQISGGHVNPAVSVGLAVIRKVSPLRAAMFVLAQLGGAIAGAALLYGAASSGLTGELGSTTPSGGVSPWRGLALEALLTAIVVFVFLSSVLPYGEGAPRPLYSGTVGWGGVGMTPRAHHRQYSNNGNPYYYHHQRHRQWGRFSPAVGSPGVHIGLAYLTATLVGFPFTGGSMNPARSLGPAFVMNKWDAHWIYWVGPILGATISALIYEYIFNPHRIGAGGVGGSTPSRNQSVDDSSSVGSEEDTYDACSKPPSVAMATASSVAMATASSAARYHYNALRPASQALNYGSSNANSSSGSRYDQQYRPAANTAPHSPLGYSHGVLYSGSGQTGTGSQQQQQQQDPSAAGYKFRPPNESIYSGSKSLYTQSPPLPRSSSLLNRSQSVYTRPAPPRIDSRQHQHRISSSTTAGTNHHHHPHAGSKSGSSSSSFFAGLTSSGSGPAKNNLYVTSASSPPPIPAGLIKPEPIYGVKHHQPDSGDSSYSTYRGSGSYSSSRSSGGGGGGPTPPVPVSRSHRSDSQTPNSVISGHSYHSPNPQY